MDFNGILIIEKFFQRKNDQLKLFCRNCMTSRPLLKSTQTYSAHADDEYVVLKYYRAVVRSILYSTTALSARAKCI